MTAADLRKLFPHASEYVIRRNSTDQGPTVPLRAGDGAELEPDAGGRAAGADRLQAALPHGHGVRAGRVAGRLAQGRVCIGLIACRHRRLDEVNLVGAFKETQDAIAAALGIDDGDERVQWSFTQLVWNGREGVMVEIEWEGLNG